MDQLCGLLASRPWPASALVRRLADWPGDVSAQGASVPLRLCGGLHALARAGDPLLAPVYPPHRAEPEALWAAVRARLAEPPPGLDGFLDHAPQTNEVRRAAPLIALARWLGTRFGLPMVLSELGASAGLNLNFDRFGLPGQSGQPGLTPDWQGDPLPAGELTVIDRRGCDLSPVDPLADRDRLLAYLWPDQPERRALMLAALAHPRVPVDRADAGDWLAGRARPVPGACHLIFHTVAWQYFPPATAARATAAIIAAGEQATDRAPLAWFGAEADGAAPGIALTLRLWPGNRTWSLGRMDAHGRWIDWRTPV
jgi:hypothetical protein